MLPSVYGGLGSRFGLDQDFTTFRVLQIFVPWQAQDQPAGKPMGILLQPGHVFLCPFRTCPGHQFVRSPEEFRELLCREATTVQLEKLAGLAEDAFDLHQDQTLLIDPTSCGVEACQEVRVDRGEANFRCSCLGHWALPLKEAGASSLSIKAVMRKGFERSLRQSRFRFQMASSNGVSSDCLGGFAT